MTFQDELNYLIGSPISASKYIYGSIFHILFARADGDTKLICNGCQWAVLDEAGTVILHDELALSSALIGDLFTGKRLRAVRADAAVLTLRFDDIVFHAFTTEEYHLDIHEGVALGSAEWQAISDGARNSFILFRPGHDASGYEFSQYFDLTAVPWGAAYLKKQEGMNG
ncbi:hypothetical protein [Rhizobium etli]|uniref:Uncharacterized protein n=1 Tax=Rhizobium etli TaxID=29449 RepID=A0A7W6Y824_RHIET|nr:hypothetical protein [Rhizobium etli]MBB4481151.1 hypothetical protein [Rhizobium etli]MBB4537234.1 hypothetical protein [Rhizobium etli]